MRKLILLSILLFPVTSTADTGWLNEIMRNCQSKDWHECGQQKMSEWQSCSKSDDCAVISDICSGWLAVNIHHESIASQYIRHKGAEVDCAISAATAKPASTCDNNQCITNDIPAPNHKKVVKKPERPWTAVSNYIRKLFHSF